MKARQNLMLWLEIIDTVRDTDKEIPFCVIADIAGVPESTVKSIARRALLKLREKAKRRNLSLPSRSAGYL